jgi:dTDP-4-dehydrorhamnose reductase
MNLIVGANGQLGKELSKLLDERGEEYVSYDAHNMDITDRDKVFEVINEIKPAVIYDTAAYTAVDKAEEEGKEINWKVNVDGTKNLADAAKEVGATIVYISTDYIFDGTNEGEYLEDSTPNPKNEYGRAKLAGEQAIVASGANYYTIRTSWVFGEFGNNFVFTMQRLAKDYDTLTVVNDQLGRPTWTRTLAEFMVHLLDHNSDFGTYQLSNDNEATWFDFATEILKDTDVKVLPVTSAEFVQKAYRPKHSVMSLAKTKSTGFEIPTWQAALANFLASIESK